MATLIRLPLLALFSFFLVAINNGNALAQNAKKKIEVLFTTMGFIQLLATFVTAQLLFKK